MTACSGRRKFIYSQQHLPMLLCLCLAPRILRTHVPQASPPASPGHPKSKKNQIENRNARQNAKRARKCRPEPSKVATTVPKVSKMEIGWKARFPLDPHLHEDPLQKAQCAICTLFIISRF